MAKRHTLRSRMSLCLAGSMLLSTMNMTVLAAEQQNTFSDTKGHWASQAIERMSSYEIINGYNGLFRPEDPITRGEMSVIINHIMGYQKSATNDFIDLEEAFYTDAVLKAYEADLLLQADGLLRPKDNITRQEVAFMIYNAFDIESSKEDLAFLDANQVADWAMESVSALAAKEVIVGSEGKFRPEDPITRAEAVTILNKLLTGYYNVAGTYTGVINGTAVINTSDANLKNVVIKGDLIIAEGVAEGDVVLDNVTVEGRTIIRGGGVNSIKVEGNSKLNDVMMAKEGSAVRLAVADSAEVSYVTVGEASTDVVVTGKIDTVKLEAKDANLIVKDAKIQAVEIVAENGKVAVEGKTDIKELNVGEMASDTKVVVEKNAKVRTVNVEAEATISGAGKVSKVNANANDVVVKTEGTTVVAGEGTTGVMAGKEPVKGGSSSNTSKPDSSGSSDDSSNTSKPEKQELAITKVESVRNGLVRVTLNRPSDKVLRKDQFSIICTGAGKDMTVLNVKTQDNKVYDLTTSYFDDNTYSLGILLEDGKLIEKDFISKYDCPEITAPEVTRKDAHNAEFTFISDTTGTFYYALGKAEATRTILSAEPTAEELIEKGTKVEMKYQYNELHITGLTENIPYTLYYVAVDQDNKVTPVKSIQIAAEPVKQPEQGTFTIVNAKGFSLRPTEFDAEMGGFEFELNQPTPEPLQIEDFKIICPRNGQLTLGRVETNDNKTYKVYMKKGYMFVTNNTYTATITFNDGTQATKKFFADVWADDVTGLEIKLTTPSALQVSFTSKENGKIYYDVTDEDQQNSNPKDPTELFEKGQVQEVKAGYNVLKPIVAKERQWFRYAIEDEFGNRMRFYSYERIKPYVQEPEVPEEENLEIINIEVDESGWDPMLIMTLNKPITIDSFNAREFKVTNISGGFMLDGDLNNSQPTDTLKVTLRGAKMNPGEHVLSFRLTYKDQDGQYKDKQFEETFTTN